MRLHDLHIFLLVQVMLAVASPARGDGQRHQRQAVERPRATESPVEARAGVFGGAALTAPTAENTTAGWSGGVEADLDFLFFGVEAEYAHSQGVHADTDEDRVSSFGENGYWVNLKLQLPFTTGRTSWKPKFGIGFGEIDADGEDALGRSFGVGFRGAYLVGGVEIEHRERLVVDVDYAVSLSASADSSLNDTLEAQTPDADFYRVRVGAYYRAEEHVLVGARYVRQGVHAENEGATFAGHRGHFDESESECLGVLLFQL